MFHNDVIKYQSKATNPRPMLTSYDSGYEHSIEHWIEVRQLVEELDGKTAVVDEVWELVAPA